MGVYYVVYRYDHEMCLRDRVDLARYGDIQTGVDVARKDAEKTKTPLHRYVLMEFDESRGTVRQLIVSDMARWI